MKNNSSSKPNDSKQVKKHPRNNTRPASTPYPHEKKSVGKQVHTQGGGHQAKTNMTGDIFSDLVSDQPSRERGWEVEE